MNYIDQIASIADTFPQSENIVETADKMALKMAEIVKEALAKGYDRNQLINELNALLVRYIDNDMKVQEEAMMHVLDRLAHYVAPDLRL